MKSKIQKREKKLSFTRTIYLSLLTILSVWSSYANISEDEKVTLDSSNETLINILSSIENQTSVSFVYGDDVKQLHLKRSINYSNGFK